MRSLTTLLILSGIIGINLFSSCFESCPGNRKRLSLPIEFCGRIDTLYHDKNRKVQPFVVVNGFESIILNDIFDEFSIGDTICKKAGSMKYYWIRNDDTVVFYQRCGSHDITDES
jgi:hypothetical protein